MDLSDTYNSINADIIESYINDHQEEHLHLDFKTMKHASLNSEDDKKNLAKAISGFANSDGGIIVWGVLAKKNPDSQVDCAQAPQKITQLRLFLTRLNAITGEAVTPRVDGVRHKIIETSEDTGFTATIVPPSDSGPHMAKLGENRYYKRSGDSFYFMEHFDLEDMFGRRKKPKLQMIIKNKFELSQEDIAIETLTLEIINQGRASARNIGFICNIFNAEVVNVQGSLKDASGLNEGRLVISYINNTGVLHPNTFSEYAGSMTLKRTNQSEYIIINYKLFCENMSTVEDSILILPIKISNALNPMGEKSTGSDHKGE